VVHPPAIGALGHSSALEILLLAACLLTYSYIVDPSCLSHYS